MELLEFIHSRYDPNRKDDPSKALPISPFEKKVTQEKNLVRVPVMLERQFLEIMYIILEDGWQVPQGAQWLDILEYLRAFESESQMC